MARSVKKSGLVLASAAAGLMALVGATAGMAMAAEAEKVNC